MKNIISGFIYFIDEKIGNSTLIIFIIRIMIFLAGLIPSLSKYTKSNILEASDGLAQVRDGQILSIDGKKYEIKLIEIK